MGQLVADHLLQEASRERRCTRVPASTWDALLSHVHGPAEALRLGDSAGGRLLYRYTVPLYQRAIDVGDELAQFRLVNLRPWDEGWDEVIHMLSEGSDIASELARQGDADGLRAQADPGNGYAFPALAELLLRRGDLDEAVKIPRARADVGDVNVRQLAGLLKQQGRGEEAERCAGAAWPRTGQSLRRGECQAPSLIVTRDTPSPAALQSSRHLVVHVSRTD